MLVLARLKSSDIICRFRFFLVENTRFGIRAFPNRVQAD